VSVCRLGAHEGSRRYLIGVTVRTNHRMEREQCQNSGFPSDIVLNTTLLDN
jgi:hypothetical protein